MVIQYLQDLLDAVDSAGEQGADPLVIVHIVSVSQTHEEDVGRQAWDQVHSHTSWLQLCMSAHKHTHKHTHKDTHAHYILCSLQSQFRDLTKQSPPCRNIHVCMVKCLNAGLVCFVALYIYYTFITPWLAVSATVKCSLVYN